MFYCKVTNKMFTTYIRQCALIWVLMCIGTIRSQLFSMDQSKILRIYGDILPKSPSIAFDNGTIVPTTEKLHVKHYSNSKINSYLSNIHKNQWFERNREEQDVTPKIISDVNNLFNQNQNGDWSPTESSFQPSWDGNQKYENNYQNSREPSRNKDSSWSVLNDESDSFSSTPESPVVSIKENRNKKRDDSNHYNQDTDYSSSKQDITDWSTQSNNFVTAPKEPKQQYSTIYKQHKTKSNQGNSVRNAHDDWSTPRSMSDFSQWLTTPQPYTEPAAKPTWVSESSNSWSPSNFDSKRVTTRPTKKPAAESLSTSGPDLEEFIARQENRYKKYNSLYSGVNSYGNPASQDILNKPRDYRQTPNSITNFNPNILKEQFDIPPNIQSFDPYSEYQDFSSSTSYYPYPSTDNVISSTTHNPLLQNNYQSNFRPNVPNNNFNSRFNNFNQGNRQGFGEPDTVIENKYQTTLKKHFDNTIDLYESQNKRTKFNPQQPGSKYNFELPSSNIKFEVTSTESPPNIIIQNYHITTDHPQNGFSEVFNQHIVPTSERPHQVDNVPQFSQNDIQLPVNYDYTPKKGHDVTFTTESSVADVPIVEIGGYSKSPPSYYEGNYMPSPPPVYYEIPHLQKTGECGTGRSNIVS